jgi:hypothetical protein
VNFFLGIDPGNHGGAILLDQTGRVSSSYLTDRGSDSAAVDFLLSAFKLTESEGVELHIGVEDIPVYIPNKGFRQQVSKLAPLFKSEGTWKGMVLMGCELFPSHSYSISPRSWQSQPLLDEISHLKSDERKEATRTMMKKHWDECNSFYDYQVNGLTEAYWIAQHVRTSINATT